MKKWMPAAILAIVMMTSACGEKKYTAQPINEEVDICAVCNMQVVDGIYATQLTMADGKNYYRCQRMLKHGYIIGIISESDIRAFLDT